MVRMLQPASGSAPRGRRALRVPCTSGPFAHLPAESLQCPCSRRCGSAGRRYDLTLPPPEQEVPKSSRSCGWPRMTEWLRPHLPVRRDCASAGQTLLGELVPRLLSHHLIVQAAIRMPTSRGEAGLCCRSSALARQGRDHAPVAPGGCCRPISATTRRRAWWPARCNAARSRASRRCYSSPTCAASRPWPIRCRAAT